MKILFPIMILILIITFSFMIAGYFIFRHTCLRKKGMGCKVMTERYAPYHKILEEALKLYDKTECEAVSVTSFDGLALSAKLVLPDDAPKAVIIAFHGFRSSAAADFSAMLPNLIEEGYAVLLPTQRAHGTSEGDYVTFGVLESKDCVSWCEFISKRFPDQSIFLLGVSMGAATVLTATGRDLPKNVSGVIADCPFSSPIKILSHVLMYKHKIYPYPIVFFVDIWARILAKFSFFGASPKSSLATSFLPVLFLHGEEDRYVPTEMSHELSEIFPDGAKRKTVVFKGAKHARAYLSDPQKYLNEIIDHINESIKK